VPSTDDRAAALRAELAALSGPVRSQPLIGLAQALAGRYWRSGAGRPASLPDLTAAIDALEESYGWLRPDDPHRRAVAFLLGQLLATRHLVHDGPSRDREVAIIVLEEALALPDPPAAASDMARTILGQLYISRAMTVFRGTDGGLARDATPLQTRIPAEALADIDRAVDHLRRVVEGDEVPAEIVQAAHTLSAMVEAIRDVFGGLGSGASGVDFGRLFQAMQAMQNLQSATSGPLASLGSGVPGMPMVLRKPTDHTPEDRPVTLVTGPEPEAPTTATRRQPQEPIAAAAPGALRRALLTTLAEASAIPDATPAGAQPAARARALIRHDAVAPDRAVIDALVAQAVLVVAAGSADPIEAAADRCLLAVALYLRGRDDSNGWGEPDESDDESTDLETAAGHLLAAIGVLPSEHPMAALIPDALHAVISAISPPFRSMAGPTTPTLPGDDITVAEVAAAARTVGVDAFVQLVPIADSDDGPAVALLLEPQTARLNLIGIVNADTDHALAAMLHGALQAGRRRPRVLLATAACAVRPLPELGGQYALTHVSSGRQLIELAARETPSITDQPAFVVNPRGGREAAAFEVMNLRQRFYPRSIGLGRLVEDTHGPGSPAAVLEQLPGPSRSGASLLQLECGLQRNGPLALELADANGPALLDVQQIRAHALLGHSTAGGLTILPIDSATEPGWAVVADALLDAGMTGIISWLSPIPNAVAALVQYVLHLKLVDDRLAPAAAADAVRCWMRDPDLAVLDELPAGHVTTLAQYNLRDPVYWSALCYRGR
jgi:hypothetical protein